VTTSFAVTPKNTLAWTTPVSSILWRAGALFAVSLALIVSGAVVLVMMCLLMLVDQSEKWDGDAFGQLFLLRGGMVQTMNRQFQPDPDADLRQVPDGFFHDSNLNDGRFSDWHIPRHLVDHRVNDQIARSTRSPHG
jgi:hypothetical protein